MNLSSTHYQSSLFSKTRQKAGDFYNSWGGYIDELAWGAAWLYRATGDESYLAKANEFYTSGLGNMFSWDDKTAGTALLLAQLTSNSKFVNDFNVFANYIKNQATKTPKGLVWLSQWGSNRYRFCNEKLD